LWCKYTVERCEGSDVTQGETVNSGEMKRATEKVVVVIIIKARRRIVVRYFCEETGSTKAVGNRSEPSRGRGVVDGSRVINV
jgi:hypothetical protein